MILRVKGSKYENQFNDITNNLLAVFSKDDTWAPQYLETHYERLRWDFAFFMENKKEFFDNKILEVGSAPFILTTALKEAGFKIVGSDISPNRLDDVINKFQIEVVPSDFEVERIPFEDGAFDIILFNEVFEHLRINLIFTMKEMHRLLKPNGKLILSTPNLYSLKTVYRLLTTGTSGPDIYKHYSKLDTLGHMGHVRLYTPKEVKIFLNKLGFRTVKIIYRGGISERRNSKKPIAKLIANTVLKCTPFLERRFTLIMEKS